MKMTIARQQALGKMIDLNAYIVMVQDISKETNVDLKTNI
jgi:hypothetical protein